MAGVVEAITSWARRTTTSFTELVAVQFPDTEVLEPEGGELIYRLRQWPHLPATLRTADVLRLLSLMSNRPVNRRWMVQHSRLPEQRIDRLIERLLAQDALDVIDPAGFAREPMVEQRAAR